MPSSLRMSATIWGLHPNNTMSACWTPLRFLFCSTVREFVREEREALMRLADSGRRTQAMKWVGIRGGRSSEGVSVPEEGCETRGVEEGFEGSEEDERMPERMAIPRVPGCC